MMTSGYSAFSSVNALVVVSLPDASCGNFKQNTQLMPSSLRPRYPFSFYVGSGHRLKLNFFPNAGGSQFCG